MTNINNGLLDGVRRIAAAVRDLSVSGGLPGVPLGYRLRGATTAGAPVTGTWRPGDIVPDRNGVHWTCTAGGTPGTWVQTGTVTGVTATDTSIVVAGTAAAPTIATGTLDVIATDHPPAANWSNNSHKITSLTNGSAASDACAFGQILAQQATTGITGYTLINGTGTIISWTPPNDGLIHRFLVVAAMHVSSTETGGQISITFTTPDGSIAATHTLFSAGATGPGDVAPAGSILYTCAPNIAVTVKQNTALTGGSSVMWAEIWGS